MDVKKLIEIILSDEKLSTSLGENVYRDTPILRPASKMENYLPPQYIEMKNIARDPKLYGNSTEIFLRQAEFMRDFEDDYEFSGKFTNYFPTYRAMNDSQLRGYFSWRTALRKGEYRKTSLSFIFVYIYELLNLIGVSSPEDGFEKLERVYLEYKAENPQLDSYLPDWLTEFAVYYSLPAEKAAKYCSAEYYSHLAVLLDPPEDDSRLFEAINALSTYDLKRSRLFKAYPELVTAVSSGVFRALAGYYSVNRLHSFCDACFGRLSEENARIFGSAVFRDKKRYENYEYRVNDVVVYRCFKGMWKKKRLYSAPNKSSLLGNYMKAADRILRAKLDFPFPMKETAIPKFVVEIINKEIARAFEEKKKNEAKKINIDLSLLDSIRVSADKTRDMLITEDEEYFDLGEEAPAAQQTPALRQPVVEEPRSEEPAEQAAEYSCGVLGKTEEEFVLCLLNGGDYKAVLRESGAVLNLICDTVNEKLFDEIGDTVIDFDGEKPFIIEDYIEDVKGLIK